MKRQKNIPRLFSRKKRLMNSNSYKIEPVLLSSLFSTDLSPELVKETGIILVDHGSRRKASNMMLQEVAQVFSSLTSWETIEIAHMELAEPSIQDAFATCVKRGAKRVIVFPYFLSPGKHWKHDIPALTQQAAQDFPGVSFLVTAPLGVDVLISALIQKRILHCIEHAEQKAPPCPYCQDHPESCQFRSSQA